MSFDKYIRQRRRGRFTVPTADLSAPIAGCIRKSSLSTALAGFICQSSSLSPYIISITPVPFRKPRLFRAGRKESARRRY